MRVKRGYVTYRHTGKVSESSDQSHRIVVLPGVQQNAGVLPGSIIGTTLGIHGRPIAVDYPNGSFRPDRVVKCLADKIMADIRAGYKKFTFVGISMGGLIAYDVIEELMRRDVSNNVIFNFVLIDSPSGGVDIRDKNARFTPYLPQIRTPHWLNRMFLGREPLPQHEQFMTDEQAFVWGAQVEACRCFPILYLLGGQVAYIVRHSNLQPAVLDRVSKLVFIRSADDKVVKSNASERWASAADGRALPVIPVEEAPHASLLEHSNKYAESIKDAMRYC